jgi:outer membrane protein
MFKENIMKKRYAVLALILASIGSLAPLGAAEPKVGIVNFENVFTETKLGKQEQASFETMRKQFTTLLEDTDKQLRDLDSKRKDQDYLDGLAPEAIQELTMKFDQLSEEMNRYNQQYYQFLQQGQHRMAQTVFGGLSQAAEKIAASKGYTMILNKQACFYSSPTLDVTPDMIKEMDKNFEEEAKKQAAAPASIPASEIVQAPVETKAEEAKKPAATASAPAEVKVEAKKEDAGKQTTAAPKEEAKKPAVATSKEEAKKPAAAPKAEEKKNGTESKKS